MKLNKEKTPLLVFYRNGEDGHIGVEFGTDSNGIAIEQQLIGALECYLEMMKKDLLDRLFVSDDESERRFT